MQQRLFWLEQLLLLFTSGSWNWSRLWFSDSYPRDVLFIYLFFIISFEGNRLVPFIMLWKIWLWRVRMDFVWGHLSKRRANTCSKKKKKSFVFVKKMWRPFSSTLQFCTTLLLVYRNEVCGHTKCEKGFRSVLLVVVRRYTVRVSLNHTYTETGLKVSERTCKQMNWGGCTLPYLHFFHCSNTFLSCGYLSASLLPVPL